MLKTATIVGRGHRSRTPLNLLPSIFHSPTSWKLSFTTPCYFSCFQFRSCPLILRYIPNGMVDLLNVRPANHPFSQSVDWIAKGAAQRGRTEGAVLPARRSGPEHDPYMTSEHSTAARWIRLGVNFEEGGNRSARRKPSKSGWDRLKLNPHTTFVVEVEGVILVHNASLTSLVNYLERDAIVTEKQLLEWISCC